MSELKLDRLRPVVRERIRPFLEDILGGSQNPVHSICVVGSSLTADFNETESDTNSIVIIREMDFGFLDRIAHLGRKYGKRKVAAPMVMTPAHIRESADVFPIEYMGIKLVHELVYGEDIFNTLDIPRDELRMQCEREAKVRTIGLAQAYVRFMGDARELEIFLAQSVSDSIHLMRAIIYLVSGAEPPLLKRDVIAVFCNITGAEMEALYSLLDFKPKRWGSSPEARVNELFRKYYEAIERAGKIVNEIAN